MKSSYIVSGAQGSGKTRIAQALAAGLGLQVLDEWDGVSEIPADSVATTNVEVMQAPAGTTVIYVERG